MASAKWLGDPMAGNPAPSNAFQTGDEAVQFALASNRFLAYTLVAKDNGNSVLLIDRPERNWVEVQTSFLYPLKEWRNVCTVQHPSTHDSDKIWGPKISEHDASVKDMKPEDRDAYRYAAHVVRHRNAGNDHSELSEWTLRDSSAGILSTQLCTAKVIEVPPEPAYRSGSDYFSFPHKKNAKGDYFQHTAFPLLELECSSDAKWHNHVFVLAVYSTAYEREAYNKLCRNDDAKAVQGKATYRLVQRSDVNFSVLFDFNAKLCESIPLAVRRVAKWGHVGPLLQNGTPGFEITYSDSMPRWLVAHRIVNDSSSKKPRCAVEALNFSGVVAEGSAIRSLAWSDGERPRMIVRSECEDLLAALIIAKSLLAVRFVSRLRMRAAIAAQPRIRAAIEEGGLHVYPPDAAASILDDMFQKRRQAAKAMHADMHNKYQEEQFAYKQFFARNLQQRQQIDTAYGAAKRTQEETAARTNREYDSRGTADAAAAADAAAKRRKGN